MEVKAKVDLEVDGKKHKKGDKFDMANTAAAYQAMRDGHVDVVGEEPPNVVTNAMASAKKK